VVGAKDRMVPLPDLTLKALRTYWSTHRHPNLLFPNARGKKENDYLAQGHMDRGAAQQAMKRVIEECGITKSRLHEEKKSLNPFAQTQLGHASPGTWLKPPSYSSYTGTFQSNNDSTLYPSHSGY